MSNLFKNIIIAVASSSVLTLLIWLLYFKTDIGFSDTIFGYMPMYAPAWFEALVTTICLPLFVGVGVHDYLYS